MQTPGTIDPAEMAEAQAWFGAAFLGRPDARPAQPGITVVANNDPVQINGRHGQPMVIAGKSFTRGLYCHAVSRLVVRLPGAASRFQAAVGVDSNSDTSGGRGSVVFRVRVGEKDLVRTPVMREGMAALALDLDLAGAEEVRLEVDDAGDGISCDQADWADARVVLADGKTVWLADLPIGGARRPHPVELPFSFRYGGRSSRDLLAQWKPEHTEVRIDANRTGHTFTWVDPTTRLSVAASAVVYADFPTVEWTVRLRNMGTGNTPLIEGFRGVDALFSGSAESEFVLNHATGTLVQASDFQPHQTTLKAGSETVFAPPGGRPLGVVFPYFNVEAGGSGAIVVVGWPGQWEARFRRDAGVGLRIEAGQQGTHFVLKPGEEVRSPLSVVQFWKGSRERSQNVWRRWMLAHSLPRTRGSLPPAHVAACSSHQFAEMINANEANQKTFVDRYLAEKIPLDYWWMDAGWYVQKGGWPQTGTWEVDRSRFPNGLRAISDHAHTKGVRTIVWFEPERVAPDTWLYTTHPEWLLGGEGQRLLDLGNPQARAWLTDHVDGLIRSERIDLYRQDYNIDPLGFWRGADAPDRQGITENHYVEGYLTYWDELLRRHPGMLIDTCASGGHRNDLETLRRSIPLLRSDYIIEPVGQQGHTYGLAPWIPYFGTGVTSTDPYIFRSQMCSAVNACFDVRRTDLDYAGMRKLFQQWQAIHDCWLGDFYGLTPWNLDSDRWIAWQFDLPEKECGIVQAFRRAESLYESARLRLRGLDPAGRYRVVDLDSDAAPFTLTGKQLMESGIALTIPRQPGAAVVTYKRTR